MLSIEFAISFDLSLSCAIMITYVFLILLSTLAIEATIIVYSLPLLNGDITIRFSGFLASDA